MDDQPIEIRYDIEFEGENLRTYIMQFDSESFLFQSEPAKENPDWTQLTFNQCENCPLNQEEHFYCPVAVNLSAAAGENKDLKSFEEVKVTVTNSERTYYKKAPLQDALYSMFGLIMATSACPHMAFLRPLARFHLPFSSYDETIVRTVGFYLIDQYLLNRDQGSSQLSLEGLEKNYENVQKVNAGLLNRFRTISSGDADANSIVVLDGFVQLLSFDFEDGFQTLNRIFQRK